MRLAVSKMMDEGVTERKSCEAVNINRSTVRYESKPEDPVNIWLRDFLKETSEKYYAWGTPMMTATARKEKNVNHKRVERIWKEEGLPLPRKKKRRVNVLPMEFWPCAATEPFETWSMDFIHDRTEYGQKLKMLSVLDDCSKHCLEVRVEKRYRAIEVIETLDELFWEYGRPKNIRTDNGPEFISRLLRNWLEKKGVTLYHINPGSPWENGYVESFHGKLRNECLNGEMFFSRGEAQVVIDWWRDLYNNERPHSSIGMISPNEFLRHKGSYGNRGKRFAFTHRSHSTTTNTTGKDQQWNLH